MIWLLLLALECPLAVEQGAGVVYARVVYEHQSEVPGKRYVAVTPREIISAGYTANLVYEGNPIGAVWFYIPPFPYDANHIAVKGCEDWSNVYPPIFADGFEDGTDDQWDRVEGANTND